MNVNACKLFPYLLGALSTSSPALIQAHSGSATAGGLLSKLLLGLFTMSTWHTAPPVVTSTGVWEKRLHLAATPEDAAVAFFEDGSYVLGGTLVEEDLSSRLFIKKCNATDHPEWSYTLLHSGQDRFQDLTIDPNQRIAVLGQTEANNVSMPLLSILSHTGEMLWSHVLNTTQPAQGSAIAAKPSGGYLITGYVLYNSSGKNIFVSDLNNAGHLQWTTVWGGSQDEAGTSVIPTSQGSLVTGYTSSYRASGSDLWITALDLSGTIAWSYLFHQHAYTYGQAIALDAYGGFMVTGYVEEAGEQDMFIAQFDDNATLHTWLVLEEEGSTQGHAIVSNQEHQHSLLGTAYFNATDQSDLFILQWNTTEILWMKVWEQEDKTIAHDITYHDEKIIVMATESTYNDRNTTQVVLLRSLSRPLDDCGMVFMPVIKNLTDHVTQTALLPTLFSFTYYLYEVNPVKVPLFVTEETLCEMVSNPLTTYSPSLLPTHYPTQHPTKRPTSNRSYGDIEERDNPMDSIIIVFLAFIGYGLGVPILNAIMEAYKEKKAQTKQFQGFLFQNRKTFGPLD